MADIKMSKYPAGVKPTGSEILLIVQGGKTYSITVAQLLDGLQKALGFTPEDKTNRNAANGYVGLSNGKIDPAVLPALNFNTRWAVASQAEMLALAANPADIAVRSDNNSVWLLTKAPASTLANWSNLGITAVGVTKILSAKSAEKTGEVKLTVADLFDLSETVRTLLAVESSTAFREALGLGTAALKDEGAFASSNHSHPAATPTASGFMSAADKVRLDGLTGGSSVVPTGLVARFPKTLKAVPNTYLALTGAVQKFDVGTYPTLDAALGPTAEPGTPGGILERAKITASDAAANDFFGYTIAISGDGTTLAVAATTDDNSGGADAGSVYIYTKSNGVWTAQQRVQASDASGSDQFGSGGIALSRDGNTLVIGTPFDATGLGALAGSVYVFTRSNGAWTQQTRIGSPDGAAQDRFGGSVAVSADGNTLVAGAFLNDKTADNAGAAYVYTRSTGAWSLKSRIQADDGAVNDRFGSSVAISADGGTVAVGSPIDDNTGGTDAGSVYVFVISGSAWAQQARVQAGDAAASDQFGKSVSLAQDGNTLLAGSPYDDNSAGSDAGSAYVFGRSNGVWSQQAKLLGSDGAASDQFGTMVALSAAGTTALIAAPYDDQSGTVTDSGSVYVFNKSGGSWVQQKKLESSDSIKDTRYGFASALTDDGNTIAVGSPYLSTSAGSAAGAAYVWERQESTPGVDKLNLPARPDSDWTWAIKL